MISVWLLNSEENLFLSDATLSLRENTMKPTTFFITASTAVSILLICCSEQCDLFLTGLVYQNGFYLHENLFVDAADTYGEYAICALFAAVCGIFALKQKFRTLISNKLNFINAKTMLFLCISFFGWCTALPYGFKIFFRRARPYQTDIFAGDCTFTNAFVKSFCPTGDSFISGHTSFAMWLFALALVMPQRIRTPSITAAAGIVLTIAASRILGGYHFLTDVYFAILLTGCGIWATYKTMFIAENCANPPETGTPVSHTTTRLYENKL